MDIDSTTDSLYCSCSSTMFNYEYPLFSLLWGFCWSEAICMNCESLLFSSHWGCCWSLHTRGGVFTQAGRHQPLWRWRQNFEPPCLCEYPPVNMTRGMSRCIGSFEWFTLSLWWCHCFYSVKIWNNSREKKHEDQTQHTMTVAVTTWRTSANHPSRHCCVEVCGWATSVAVWQLCSVCPRPQALNFPSFLWSYCCCVPRIKIAWVIYMRIHDHWAFGAL